MTRPAQQGRAKPRSKHRSTGPKTQSGKARSAINALHHGLATSVYSEQHLEEKVESLAVLLAGKEASRKKLDVARRIAESEVDILRIRRARVAILSDPEWRYRKQKFPTAIREVARMFEPVTIALRQANAARAKLLGLGDGIVRPPTLLEGLNVLSPHLSACDRYERRALSRRKRAIREFAAL